MNEVLVLKVGIIGCGQISSIYIENSKKFNGFDVAACADLDIERAKEQAEKYDIPKACSVDELLQDPSIEIVINLTIPKAHAEVSLAALEAEKHVYLEKPLAINFEDGKKVLETAKSKGLLVGGAPDTFLGGGLQTCRKLIDDGWIGEPVAATAFMMGNGPEGWHANPEFFYEEGAGPLFDMGPYYITALVNLMGPIQRVTGSAKITYSERMIKSQPKYGQMISVQTPTHVTGILDFTNGGTATMITSFDVKGGSKLPRIEIYGEYGTLGVPDPNTFDGPVFIKKQGERDWQEVPLSHGFTANSRGIGLLDMVSAIKNSRAHRSSGDLTLHVLETMSGILQSAKESRPYDLTSSLERPKAFPTGLGMNTIEQLK
jgi:predicted dehydrogenase